MIRVVFHADAVRAALRQAGALVDDLTQGGAPLESGRHPGRRFWLIGVARLVPCGARTQVLRKAPAIKIGDCTKPRPSSRRTH